MPPLRIEICHELDERTLARILDLVERNARADGHQPIGEHKHAHLRVGASRWSGVLAWEGDDLVGYTHVLWGSRPRLRVEVVVDPRVRSDGGVARRLIDEARALLADDGGGTLWLWVHHVRDARATLAYEMGFVIERELAYMSRPLAEPCGAGDPPRGVTVRSYRPGTDDDALLEVNNAAFPDHPENGGWDRDELASRRRLEWFDPDGVLMAWRGDEPVGFHWTKWHGHEGDRVPAHEPVGEVYVLAVHPRAQRMGLGRYLLAAGLDHLHARGCRTATLYVDLAAARPVALYTAAGFTVQHSEVCYSSEVRSSRDTPVGSSL